MTSDAYDNNKAVPDAAGLNAERIAASLIFRSRPGAHLDIPYGPKERQKWDIFPAANPSAPCLIFIHGGYWQRNRREEFACLAEGMTDHGWSVALPGYSLAPEANLRDITEEIRCALDWLRAYGSDYGVAGKVVISGWSAGAQLAVLLLNHPVISAGLAISGVYELEPLRLTPLNDALKLTDQEVAGLSPLRLPVSPKPLIIAYGSNELAALVNDSVALHEKRVADHASSRLMPIAGANHFTILRELRAADGQLIPPLRSLVPQG
jgi:acetyl esterase/lipase